MDLNSEIMFCMSAKIKWFLQTCLLLGLDPKGLFSQQSNSSSSQVAFLAVENGREIFFANSPLLLQIPSFLHTGPLIFRNTVAVGTEGCWQRGEEGKGPLNSLTLFVFLKIQIQVSLVCVHQSFLSLRKVGHNWLLMRWQKSELSLIYTNNISQIVCVRVCVYV